MAKMSFNKTVKYQGSIYLPNIAFEVSDLDVADLKKAGGCLEEESKKDSKVDIDRKNKNVTDDEIGDDEINDENEEPEKTELELLRDEADELGIEYGDKWGVKKLTRIITEAKA